MYGHTGSGAEAVMIPPGCLSPLLRRLDLCGAATGTISKPREAGVGGKVQAAVQPSSSFARKVRRRMSQYSLLEIIHNSLMFHFLTTWDKIKPMQTYYTCDYIILLSWTFTFLLLTLSTATYFARRLQRLQLRLLF